MTQSSTIRASNLIAGLLTGLAATLPASAADLNVPADYATIQAAVNAASAGDSIRIAPGVYVEQVTITNKNLTLSGAPGAVMRAETGMSSTLSAYGFGDTAALMGAALSDVVVKGLTFEGEHLAETFPGASYCAIGFAGCNGRVEDCLVRGFRKASGPFGFLNAFGILSVNDRSLDTPTVDVQIMRCALADNAASIIMSGSLFSDISARRVTFAIQDNIIEGNGPMLGNQVGLLIGAGATGDVRRNRITNHYNAQPGSDIPYSFGIYAVDWLVFIGSHDNFAPLLPVRYECNTLVSNQLNLVSALGHGSQFVNNNLEGAGGTNSRLGGLALSGNTNVVIGNCFSDLSTGLTLIGNDPFFGSVLGIATSPALISNRFCHVTTPIVTQPLVTGVTNRDTIVCPFPDPKLVIARAIVLTWPDYTEGWILESAPTMNGPWSTADVTPILRKGQNTVTVTTDNLQQFFRLRKP